MGSRKFVKDITSFSCKSLDESDHSCVEPFKSSLAFQNIKLDQISTVVELNQIGKYIECHLQGINWVTGAMSSTLYIHQDSNEPLPLVETLMSVSETSTGVNTVFQSVDNVAKGLPGIPPSSLMTFLQANAKIDGVVITDYETQYRNPYVSYNMNVYSRLRRYYHTHFDDGTNPWVNRSQVCDAATLVARSLYVLATGSSPSSPEVEAITADCQEVEELIYCLTTGFKACKLSHEILPDYGKLSDVKRNEIYCYC